MADLNFSWPHCKRQTLAAQRNSICRSNVFKIRKSWTTLRWVCLKQTQGRDSSFNSPAPAVLPLFWLLTGQWLQLKSRVARALARAWRRTLGRGSRRLSALNRCSCKGANLICLTLLSRNSLCIPDCWSMLLLCRSKMPMLFSPRCLEGAKSHWWWTELRCLWKKVRTLLWDLLRRQSRLNPPRSHRSLSNRRPSLGTPSWRVDRPSCTQKIQCRWTY